MPNIVFKKYEQANTDGKTMVDIEIGIFFDGTRNNKYNSDAREAAKNSEDYKAFEKYGKKDKKSSYYNDWSNVARMWKHYSKDNAIYVEGIGTGQDSIEHNTLTEDTTIAFALGAGPTGIRRKVRKGCEYLAQKISTAKKQIKKDEILRTIYLDVFGFSRGAAAARNFNYEIYKNKYYPKRKTINQEGVKTTTYLDSYNIPYQTICSNEKPKYTMLPACGHLGYCLKELGVDIKKTQIVVRTLGLYDTVSSYMKYIDFRFSNMNITPDFSNDVEELKLNNLKAQNIIHFTARDEHRENFALTRIPFGIEKSFPGVHSDIGGGYLTGKEIVKEIETEWFVQLKKNGSEELYKLQKLLISEGWFKDNKELRLVKGEIVPVPVLIPLPAPVPVSVRVPLPYTLYSNRYLKKEYSYIPLHFMTDYLFKSSNIIERHELYEEYSINDNPLLIKIKKYLAPYINNLTEEEPLQFKWFSQINKNDKESIQQQHDLRELRNKYLHWSSSREGLGMDPNTKWYDLSDYAAEGRKRKEY